MTDLATLSVNAQRLVLADRIGLRARVEDNALVLPADSQPRVVNGGAVRENALPETANAAVA
jgi:hypothetical protein